MTETTEKTPTHLCLLKVYEEFKAAAFLHEDATNVKILALGALPGHRYGRQLEAKVEGLAKAKSKQSVSLYSMGYVVTGTRETCLAGQGWSLNRYYNRLGFQTAKVDATCPLTPGEEQRIGGADMKKCLQRIV